MQAPGAAVTLRHAAGVVAAVAAVPSELPDGLAQHSDSYLGMHLHAAVLLAACCNGLGLFAAAELGSGGSSGGSAAADVGYELLAAMWELIAAVPHMCSAVRALAASAAAADLGSLKVQAEIINLYSSCLTGVPFWLALRPLLSCAALSLGRGSRGLPSAAASAGAA